MAARRTGDRESGLAAKKLRGAPVPRAICPIPAPRIRATAAGMTAAAATTAAAAAAAAVAVAAATAAPPAATGVAARTRAGAAPEDPEVRRMLDRWVESKRQRDFGTADKLRSQLEARGVRPEQARPHTWEPPGRGRAPGSHAGATACRRRPRAAGAARRPARAGRDGAPSAGHRHERRRLAVRLVPQLELGKAKGVARYHPLPTHTSPSLRRRSHPLPSLLSLAATCATRPRAG